MKQRLRSWWAVLAGVVAAAILAGFMGLSQAAAAQASLDGTQWVLTGWSSPDAIVTVDNQPITLEFKDGQVFGFAGCNRYFGPAMVNGSSITIGPDLAMTGMASLEPTSEEAYIGFLTSADRWALDGSQLTLSVGSQVVLTFARA